MTKLRFVRSAFTLSSRAPLIVAACAALTAPTGGLADAPQEWQQRSERSHFVARLRPHDGDIDIGVFEKWILELRAADGAPVDQARIAIGGGMPGHGHGLPTQPLVTDYLGDGQYLIEGVRLSMAGRWILAFGVETQRARDRLIFEMVVDSWSASDRRILASLYLDPATRPPPSPSNRVADHPEAARLGEKLFFDHRLSGNGTLSCASCHQPDRYFTDGLPRGVGINKSGRNTPTVVGAAFLSWFYWDGRRDSLWSQALVPFEAADEMGSSRTAVVRLIGQNPGYRSQYERIFGAFPTAVLSPALPEHAGPLGAKPTRDAWHRIGRRDAQVINAIYANLGKAIAAYERTLPLPVTRFDRYVEAVLAGDAEADALLTTEERNGLELFLDSERTHCQRCHNGPWFTNGGFHNIGTGNFSGENLDFGRVFGVRSVVMDEFNCVGPYSDATPDQCAELRFLNRSTHVPLEGAFKVPSLRNLTATAPYMHDGRFPDLESVLAFYRRPPGEGTTHELPELDLSEDEARQLVAFLESLSFEWPPSDGEPASAAGANTGRTRSH